MNQALSTIHEDNCAAYQDQRIAELTRERNQLLGIVGRYEMMALDGGCKATGLDATDKNVRRITNVLEAAIGVRFCWDKYGAASETWERLDELSGAVAEMEGDEPEKDPKPVDELMARTCDRNKEAGREQSAEEARGYALADGEG